MNTLRAQAYMAALRVYLRDEDETLSLAARAFASALQNHLDLVVIEQCKHLVSEEIILRKSA